MSDSEAKDILLNAITPATRTYLERKLEAVLEDDDIMDDYVIPADRVELIPFATIARLLNRGRLLESYPAKASKVDLRMKGMPDDSKPSALAAMTSAAAPAAAPTTTAP